MITYFNAQELSNNGGFNLGGINASGQVGLSYDTFARGFNSSEYTDPSHIGKLGSHRHRHAKGCLHQAVLEWRT